MIEPRIRDAFRADAFPSNPRPFLRALDSHCEQHGSGALDSDDARAVMLVLIQMAWGQLARVDTVAEFERLDKVLPIGGSAVCARCEHSPTEHTGECTVPGCSCFRFVS